MRIFIIIGLDSGDLQENLDYTNTDLDVGLTEKFGTFHSFLVLVGASISHNDNNGFCIWACLE